VNGNSRKARKAGAVFYRRIVADWVNLAKEKMAEILRPLKNKDLGAGKVGKRSKILQIISE
jgi:hypothetical protein